MSERTLILRTQHMDEVVAHLREMGLDFVKEQHISSTETGPIHYACEVNGKVLEIYPGGPQGRVNWWPRD